MSADKFGPGFDKEEFKSPLYVAPHDGQEGWTPMNPEVPFAHDPLGYLTEHDKPAKKERY